jgi:hypothetical protein
VVNFKAASILFLLFYLFKNSLLMRAKLRSYYHSGLKRLRVTWVFEVSEKVNNSQSALIYIKRNKKYAIILDDII